MGRDSSVRRIHGRQGARPAISEDRGLVRASDPPLPRANYTLPMSRTERTPLLALLLPVLTVLAIASATATPDHLLLTLALAGLAALAVTSGAAPVGAQVVSVQHRSEVCRASGVRSCDPDRPGPVRPRAPGLR